MPRPFFVANVALLAGGSFPGVSLAAEVPQAAWMSAMLLLGLGLGAATVALIARFKPAPAEAGPLLPVDPSVPEPPSYPIHAEDLHASTFIEAQRQSLEMVVTGQSLGEVLGYLTRIVERLAGGQVVASILLLDEHGCLRHGAAPSLPDDYNSAIDGIQARADLGTCSAAAVTGKVVITPDIAADPNWDSIRQLPLGLGLRAAWSQPITSRDGRVLGTFGTYFRECREPTPLERRAVEILARNAALTIERARAEAALRENQQKLQLALASAEMGTWVYTFDDSIVRLDAAAQRLYEQPDPGWLHTEETMRGVLHDDDIPSMWSAVAKACDPAGDGRYRAEYRIVLPGGNVRWLSAWGTTEFREEGGSRSPVRIVGATRDITASREAEVLLRRSSETFEHLIQNSPFGVYVVDSDFRLVQVSAGAQKVFSSVKPLLGRDFAAVLRTIWAEPFATAAIELFKRTLETGEPYHAPNTVENRADIAATEAYDWKIERITLPDGRYGVVCNFYDLSERQRYEDSLRESEARFRAMADSAPVLIWMSDEDKRGTFFNKPWLEFTGRSVEQESGEGWLEGVHSDDLNAITRCQEAFESRAPFTTQFRLRRHDGLYRWVLDTGVPRFTEDGQFAGYIGSCIDISERMESERALRRANEDLLQFASIASHDLKEPLRGMALLANFIEKDDADSLSPDGHARLARIRALSERLTCMVNNLLDHARTGLHPVLQPCDLNEVVRRVIDTSAEDLATTSAQVVVRGELPTILADHTLMERIFSNLITNAVKFNNSAIKRVEIFASGDAIAVRDNGIGIDARHQATIFRLLRRVHSEARYPGQGLGLAVVRKIVEAHGGTISLESTPGAGSTFWLRFSPGAVCSHAPLPVSTAEPAESASAVASSSALMAD
jgi:PAS domain S-box-containing protein